jgi:cytochrome c-type biogenesis protein CcmH
MNGTLVLLLMIAGALAALWIAKVRGPALKLAAAGLLVGGGGYLLQGDPGHRGSPATAAAVAEPLSLARARHAFFGEFNASERWLLMSDAFARRGKTTEAAGILQTAVRKYPGDLPLAIGFANALVEQGGGMTPAAELAFARAEALAPGHPATGFFRGLAIGRSGDPEKGLAIWRQVLASAPAEASWRPLVEDGVAALSPTAETSAPRR